jgi:hypothetical protein
MKALCLALLLLVCVSVPVFAGEIPVTPCKENCGQAAVSSPIPLRAQIVLALLGIFSS